MFLKRMLCAAAAAALLGGCASVPGERTVCETPAETVAPAPEVSRSWGNLWMGTLVNFRLYAPDEATLARFCELAEAEVGRFDDMMTVHRPSPLNSVNAHAGQPVEVTPEIAEMTRQALAIADETGGAFDPMIGPVVNLWKVGFGGQHVPDAKAIAAAVRLVDRSKVKVREENGHYTVQIAPGQFMDMGAIAKGYIGTKIADELKKAGLTHGLLDLGGNIVAIGEKRPGVPWTVGVQSPDKLRGEFFAAVSVRDESVITSGAYERFFEENGKRYAHILDPKTGRPVKTDMGSVTIVDADGARADALCTALFAMGWEKGSAFLRAHPDLRALILNADGTEAAVTPALQNDIRPAAASSVKLTVLH